MNTSTPKVVIMAVVVILGVFALAALASITTLILADKNTSTIAIIVGPMGVAIGAVAGVLASTRTTDPLPAALGPIVGTVAQHAAPDVAPTVTEPVTDHAA